MATKTRIRMLSECYPNALFYQFNNVHSVYMICVYGTEDARAAALLRYKILAGLMGILSVGHLTIGIIAVDKYPDSGASRTPYFVGCFIIGIVGIIHAAVCTYLAFKGHEFAEDDIKKRKIGCLITGQYKLSLIILIGCFVGAILAGIGGLNTDPYVYKHNEGTGSTDNVRLLAGIIIAGCILALGVTIFGMFIVCTYGKYFGVRFKTDRRGRRVVITFGNTVSTTNTAYGGSGMGGVGANANTQNLQDQNRLLQEQQRLQQEMIITQQRAQGAQFGFNPPPPANYPSVGTYPAPIPAFPPGPPPSYGNI